MGIYHPLSRRRSFSQGTGYFVFGLILSALAVFFVFHYTLSNSAISTTRKENSSTNENAKSSPLSADPAGDGLYDNRNYQTLIGGSPAGMPTIPPGDLINVLTATGKNDLYFMRKISLVDEVDTQASKSSFSAPSNGTRNVLLRDLFSPFYSSNQLNYRLVYAYAIPMGQYHPERCIDYGEEIIQQMGVKVNMHAVLIGYFADPQGPQKGGSNNPNPFSFAFTHGVSYCVLLLRCESPPDEQVLKAIGERVGVGKGSFTQSHNPGSGKTFATVLESFPFLKSLQVVYAARRYSLKHQQRRLPFSPPPRPEVTLGTNSVFVRMLNLCFYAQALDDDKTYNLPQVRFQTGTEKPLNLPSLELLAVYDRLSPDACAALCWRQSSWGGGDWDDTSSDCRTFLLRYKEIDGDEHDTPTCELYRHQVEDLFPYNQDALISSSLYLFTLPSTSLSEASQCADGIIGTKSQSKWEKFIVEKFSGMSSYSARHDEDPLENVKSFNNFQNAVQVGCVQGKAMISGQLGMPELALAQATLSPDTGIQFTDKQACESTLRSISQLQPLEHYFIPENEFPKRVSNCEQFTSILSSHCQKQIVGGRIGIGMKGSSCSHRSFRLCYPHWSLHDVYNMDRCLSALDYDQLKISEQEFPPRVHPHHMFAKLVPLFRSEVRMVLSVKESMLAHKQLSLDLLDSAISELNTFRSYSLVNAPLHFSFDWSVVDRGSVTSSSTITKIASIGYVFGGLLAFVPGADAMSVMVSLIASGMTLYNSLTNSGGVNSLEHIFHYDKVLNDPYKVEKNYLSMVLQNLQENRERIHNSEIPWLKKILSGMESLISYHYMIERGLVSFIPFRNGELLDKLPNRQEHHMNIRFSVLNTAVSSNFNLCVQRFSLLAWETLAPTVQIDPFNPFSYFDVQNSFKFRRSVAFEKFITHYNTVPGVNLDDPVHPSNMPTYFYILPMWNVDDSQAQLDLQTAFEKNQKQSVQFVAAYLCLNANMNPINSYQFEMYRNLFNEYIGETLIRSILPSSLQGDRLDWETLALEPFLQFEYPVADTFTYYGLRLPVHYVNMFRFFYGPLKRLSPITPNSTHPFEAFAGGNYKCCRPPEALNTPLKCNELCRTFRNRWAYDDEIDNDYTRRVCAVNGQTKIFDPRTAINSAALRSNVLNPGKSLDLGTNIFVDTIRLCTKDCAFTAGDKEYVSNGYFSFYNNGFYPNFEGFEKDLVKRSTSAAVGYSSTARFGDSISTFQKLHTEVFIPWKSNPLQEVISNLDKSENSLQRVNDFMFFSYKEPDTSESSGWEDSPDLRTFFSY